jgi:hypothetical protein
MDTAGYARNAVVTPADIGGMGVLNNATAQWVRDQSLLQASSRRLINMRGAVQALTTRCRTPRSERRSGDQFSPSRAPFFSSACRVLENQ